MRGVNYRLDKVKKYIDLFQKRDSICVSHYPVPVSVHSATEVKELMELESPQNSMKEVALYIHVPFCDVICSFCPFNKYLRRSEQVGEYIDALMKEIELYSHTAYGKNAEVKSVNFGGGTPTSLSQEEMKSILCKLKSSFKVAKDAIIFIEGNPKNFSLEKLVSFREEGLNRISVGVQTFQPHLAEILGLYHSVEESVQLVYNAKKAGIDNIGIDLMYNTPGQSFEDWKADIEKSIELGIDHICLISFCIVPGTKISEKIQKGLTPENGDFNNEVRLYRYAGEALKRAGYEQYSVIDFAKPGKIDMHALMYFGRQADLIGMGPAAFGYINGYMYINAGDLPEYVKRLNAGELPVRCGEKADKTEIAHGMMAKGLRMLSVKRKDFKNRFAREPEELFGDTILKLLKEGLITVNEEGIHLTEDGMIWGNNVCKEFFSEKYKNCGLQERMKLAKGQAIQTGGEVCNE